MTLNDLVPYLLVGALGGVLGLLAAPKLIESPRPECDAACYPLRVLACSDTQGRTGRDPKTVAVCLLLDETVEARVVTP